MSTMHETARDVALPRSAFASLRTELEAEVGALPAIHALHAAGHAAGATAATDFGRGVPDVAAMPEDVFWTRMTTFLRQRGWGTLTHRSAVDAIGLLVSGDWAEVTDGPADEAASCSFSTGFLGGLLTRLGGGPIAVLEVSCRGRGDDTCTFAFGSEGAVHRLYGRLLDGADLTRALGSL